MNRLRVRHREDFAAVRRQTVRLAQGAGLVRLGRVAIDGTKVRANTSRSKARSHERMVAREARLEAEIATILQRLDAVNAAEDSEHGEDDDGSGGRPATLPDRQQGLASLQAVRAQLEREKGDALKPTHQKSLADPEANMMRVGNDGALPDAYNAQAATSEDGVIVAVGLTANATDVAQAIPMVAAVQTMTGAAPGCAVMETGHLSEAHLAALRAQGQRCLIAGGREGKRARWPRGIETQRMHRLLRLPWARRRDGKRKTQGERRFAEIKQGMRLRRCQLRGYRKVWGEWNLVAAACNLRRVFALGVAPA